MSLEEDIACVHFKIRNVPGGDVAGKRDMQAGLSEKEFDQIARDIAKRGNIYSKRIIFYLIHF